MCIANTLFMNSGPLDCGVQPQKGAMTLMMEVCGVCFFEDNVL